MVRTTAAALALSVLPLLLPGCGGQTAATYDDALAAYDAKRYGESLRVATELQQGSEDQAQRQQAAYVAGLAAYQLNRFEDARGSFAIAAKSADASTAGRATAMLGAIAVEQRRWGDAERYYTAAASMLTGPEATRARDQAREAREYAEGVRRESKEAPRPTPSPAPARGAGSGTAPPAASAPEKGNWTVVAGTFSSETAARQRATVLAAEAKRLNLGVPRVVSSNAGGKRLWIVELGSFDTRAKAEAARKKAPVPDAAVAPSLR